MNTPDRLTLLSNLLIVFPLLLFLPGYILTRTFLRFFSTASFSEVMVLRVLLSFIVTSILGLGIAWASVFTTQNLVFAAVAVSFCFFLMKRFRLFHGAWSFRIVKEDFLSGLIVMGALFLFLWPNEEVGSTFTLGVYLARIGSLGDPPNLPVGLDLLGKAPLGSIWFGIINSFFGLRLSLLTIPVISVLSMLVMFVWSKRMFGVWGALASVGFLATNFTALWFYRLPEGYVLAQLFILGAFYLLHLYFSEGNKGFLIAAVFSLILAFLARVEVLTLLAFFGGAFFITWTLIRVQSTGEELRTSRQGDFSNENRKLPAAWMRFCLLIPISWLFFMFQAPSHVVWAISPWLWVMAGSGAFLFLWKEAEIKDLVLLICFLIYPIFLIWRNPGEGPYMINLVALGPLVLPSVSLFAGYLMSFFFRAGTIAKWIAAVALIIITASPLYLNRHLIWFQQYQGLLKFYETMRKSFLPNDLVFSYESELASLLWRLYGLKVYVLGPEGVDVDFQKEISFWLKDGGRAYVISSAENPVIEGFVLRLHSVERLRALALEKTMNPPKEKLLQEILVRIYEASPKEFPKAS